MGTSATAAGAAGRVPHRYGRGKFAVAAGRIEYMEMIVEHQNYAGMPGARDATGRISWQVSSGRTTSFNKFYEARWKWWEATADRLELRGSGGENDRFTIAARLIHPTGYRPCLICGQERNVGYFYLNANLSKRLEKVAGAGLFPQGMSIADAIESLEELGIDVDDAIRPRFLERALYFDELGVSAAAFEASRHVRTSWLSPGFMGDPPHRLDGLHDYCNLGCRRGSDPGRSAENLRSYQVDRRAFEYWSEGDWQMANDLYNRAGPGICGVCGASVERVSPDHVGPLACGFKQMPLFLPTCGPCNSSKNRRMKLRDVQRLIEYERETGQSVASWHVRSLWDQYKGSVASNEDAAEVSAHMRTMVDCYLRTLYALLRTGNARFLGSLLSPGYAFFDHEFVDLNPGALTFTRVESRPKDTNYRASLARRSIRIAFDELVAYVQKGALKRKLRSGYVDACEEVAARAVEYAQSLGAAPEDRSWAKVMDARAELSDDEFEAAIGLVLPSDDEATRPKDGTMREFLESEFTRLADQLGPRFVAAAGPSDLL